MSLVASIHIIARDNRPRENKISDGEARYSQVTSLSSKCTGLITILKMKMIGFVSILLHAASAIAFPDETLIRRIGRIDRARPG